MSNSDQLRYLKMEEQIAMSDRCKMRNVLIDASPPPPINVNASGEIIFDEASLGILDEHIRKVVREEMQAMKTHLFKEFEQYITQQFRLHGGYGNV